MAEATLSKTFTDLQKSVGELLGFGVTTANWDSAQTDIVARMIHAGTLRFYGDHHWKFLEIMDELVTVAQYSTGTVTYDHTGGANERQVTLASGTWPSWAASGRVTLDGGKYDVDTRVSDTIITLTSSSNPGSDVAAGTTYKITQEDYDLPDHFGYLVGDVTYGPNDRWWPMKNVGEGMIRNMRTNEGVSETGKPTYVAVRPKSVDLTNGQRYELMFSPAPDAAYHVHYKFRTHHDKLDATNLYHLGGAMHAKTIEAACLYEAALRQNDDPGVWGQEYEKALARSISYDSRALGQNFFGYNADNSDDLEQARGQSPRTQNVTYKNVLYGG